MVEMVSFPPMAWNAELPTRVLPDYIAKEVRDEAQFLLDDMRANPRIIDLIPAPVPMHPTHMIYATRSTRPQWYVDLYEQRRFKEGGSFVWTRVESALERIIDGNDKPLVRGKERKNNRYDFRMRAFAWSRLLEGYMHDGYEREPSENVVAYERAGRPLAPWKPEWPAWLLPPMINRLFRDHAERLYDHLVTIRSGHGGLVKSHDVQEIEWYLRYKRKKKDNEFHYSLESLRRIRAQEDLFEDDGTKSEMTDTYYRRIIKDHLTDGYLLRGKTHTGNLFFKAYFEKQRSTHR